MSPDTFSLVLLALVLVLVAAHSRALREENRWLRDRVRGLEADLLATVNPRGYALRVQQPIREEQESLPVAFVEKPEDEDPLPAVFRRQRHITPKAPETHEQAEARFQEG